MCNLMQSSIKDFSVYENQLSMKNIPQNKTNITVCCKNKEIQGHSFDRKQYAMGKKTYINV